MINSKKIVFVLDDLNVGGIQKVNVVLAEKLSEKYDVSILTIHSKRTAFSTEDIQLGMRNYIILISNLLLECFSYLKIKSLQKIFLEIQTWQIIKKVKKIDPDCIILNADTILFLPFLKKGFRQVKFIAWCHSSAKVYFDNYFKLVRTFLEQGLREADEVICLSKEDFSIFSEYNVNTKVIYNPLTIENNGVSSLESQIISWTGRLVVETKGLDFLAMIASKIPADWKISVAGSGTKKEEIEFQNIIKMYDAEDKFIFRGTLQGKELNEHYKDSSMYLMTSRWEGFGLVLTEAMAFGLPILAFEQNGSSEILENGKYGILVKKGEICEMSKMIKQLIENNDLRSEYSQKSLKRVEDFKLENIITRWEQIL